MRMEISVLTFFAHVLHLDQNEAQGPNQVNIQAALYDVKT